MTPDFQSPTLFILGFGLLQALLIIAVILGKGGKNRTASLYLVGLVVSITVLLLCKILSKSWLWTYALNFYLTGYFIPFLIGPFLFLYVRQSLEPRRSVRLNDVVHFFPFIFFVFDNSLYDMTGRSVLLWIPSIIRSLRYFQGTIQLFSIIGYGWASWARIKEHRTSAVNYLSNHHQTELGWLKELVMMVAISGVVATMTLHAMSILFPNYQELRWVFLILSVLIYWITFKLIWDPILLFENEKASVEPTKDKYTGSGLKDEQAMTILTRLKELMDGKKPFLDPTITAERLSTMLGVSRHHISQALNMKARKNFYDFVNEYRVNEAKRLLTDARFKHLSIAGIGSESGFNSVSSFNLVFKKHSGMTPSQFKKAEIPGRPNDQHLIPHIQ